MRGPNVTHVGTAVGPYNIITRDLLQISQEVEEFAVAGPARGEREALLPGRRGHRLNHSHKFPEIVGLCIERHRAGSITPEQPVDVPRDTAAGAGGLDLHPA